MTPVISEVEIQPGGPGYGLQSVGSQLDSAQTLGHAQCHQQLDRDRLPSQRLEGHFTKRPLKHGTAYLYIYMYTHIIICIIYIYTYIYVVKKQRFPADLSLNIFSGAWNILPMRIKLQPIQNQLRFWVVSLWAQQWYKPHMTPTIGLW